MRTQNILNAVAAKHSWNDKSQVLVSLHFIEGLISKGVITIDDFYDSIEETAMEVEKKLRLTSPKA